MTAPAATIGAVPAKHKGIFSHLYVQVLIAITIGVILGILSPSDPSKVPPWLRDWALLPSGWAESMKWLGDVFIKMIKMVIAPIIFLTVVHGIASMKDMKAVGRVGLKAMIYFLFMTLLALIIGLVVVNVLQPGVGMNIDPKALDTKAVEGFLKAGKEQSTIDFLLKIVPSSVVDAFAKGEILQVLFFSILFAFALLAMGDYGTPVLDLIDRLAHAFFGIIGYVMKFAPIGAFGAMAFTIGKFGLQSLIQLGYLMAAFYTTCLLFVIIVLGAVSAMAGFSLFKLIRYIKEELLIVLGTSSSESVLPRMMVKMENLGAKESVVGLVIPTGYSFNLDGTCIYLTMAAIFLAQATNTPMTLGDQIGLLMVLLLTSKGAAAVTGGGFIVLAATLGAVGNIPAASIALLLGVDRFMSEARALTNLVGNAVATLVVAKWEGALDVEKMHRHLNERPRRVTPDDAADEPEAVLEAVTHNHPVGQAPDTQPVPGAR